jgi:hypothetical protein
MAEAVLIDFAGTFASQQPNMMYYYDLSPEGNILEAISRVYDVLRWAETKADAKCVLIINLMHFEFKGTGGEHIEALFDRLFRATSGNNA